MQKRGTGPTDPLHERSKLGYIIHVHVYKAIPNVIVVFPSSARVIIDHPHNVTIMSIILIFGIPVLLISIHLFERVRRMLPYITAELDYFGHSKCDCS